MEALLGLSKAHGDIDGLLDTACAFVESVERKAIIGHLRSVNRLIMDEIPHTVNFESLIETCQELGCEYLAEIKKGNNAKKQLKVSCKKLWKYWAKSFFMILLKSSESFPSWP